jgi:hypothetical protein
MAHQHRSLYICIPQDGINRARKVIHAVSDLRLVALSMARKVNQDYTITFRELDI